MSAGGPILQSFSDTPSELVLHYDHFPGISILKPETHPFSIAVEGAPNFRAEVCGEVFGCGFPEKPAISKILTRARAHPEQKIHWLNMRGEPVVYLDHLPFTVRLKSAPFQNLLLDGISAEDLEAIESELIRHLEKTLRTEGALPVWRESTEGALTPVRIRPEWMETPREAFHHEAKARNFQYHRIPMLDEMAPHPASIDGVLKAFRQSQAPGESEAPRFIVNCQMGRGRTTFTQAMLYRLSGHSHEEAMAAASRIFHLRDIVESPKYQDPKYASVKEAYQARYERFQEFSEYRVQSSGETFSAWLVARTGRDSARFRHCAREFLGALDFGNGI